MKFSQLVVFVGVINVLISGCMSHDKVTRVASSGEFSTQFASGTRSITQQSHIAETKWISSHDIPLDDKVHWGSLAVDLADSSGQFPLDILFYCRQYYSNNMQLHDLISHFTTKWDQRTQTGRLRGSTSAQEPHWQVTERILSFSPQDATAANIFYIIAGNITACARSHHVTKISMANGDQAIASVVDTWSTLERHPYDVTVVYNYVVLTEDQHKIIELTISQEQKPPPAPAPAIRWNNPNPKTVISAMTTLR